MPMQTRQRQITGGQCVCVCSGRQSSISLVPTPTSSSQSGRWGWPSEWGGMSAAPLCFTAHYFAFYLSSIWFIHSIRRCWCCCCFHSAAILSAILSHCPQLLLAVVDYCSIRSVNSYLLPITTSSSSSTQTALCCLFGDAAKLVSQHMTNQYVLWKEVPLCGLAKVKVH